MAKLVKSMVTAATAAAAGVLVFASLAWACTPQSTITISLITALPRTQTLATGEVLKPGPVEIRWNRADGPLVSPAIQPKDASFSTTVTIPEAAPGVYYVLLVSDGEILARKPVEVLPSPTAGSTPAVGASSERTASDGLWDGFTHDSTAGTAGPLSGSSPGRPSPIPAIGVAALSFGVTALAGLAGVAATRSRRARGLPDSPSSP